MDARRDDELDHTPERATVSGAPGEARDAVETRDPHTRAVPRDRSRAWLYTVPAMVLLLVGLVWMAGVERPRSVADAPYEVTGTSGERANDPEGGPRADEPLNPVPQGPSVISNMELLTSKREYVGRSVQFSAIPVVNVTGPRTFWVGRIGNRTLVVVDGGTQVTKELHAGDIVTLSGTLAPKDEDLDRSGLERDERDAIEGESVIIRATRVQPSGH